jgi:hypothetical protein
VWLFSFVVAGVRALSAGVPVEQSLTGTLASAPWIGPAGIRETVSEIMAREAQTAAQEQPPPRIKPVLRPDRRGLPQNPDSPAGPAELLQASGVERGALSPQTLGTSFTGATLADINAFPPDTMGAAGPTQFIVAVNGRIRSFNKTTGVADGALNATMDTFFNSVMTPPTGSNFTSDPRIRYDRLSGRWIVVMIDVPGGAGLLPNRVLLAVSSGNTVTSSSSFTFFYFQHDTVSPAGDTNNFADYPTLGIDNNALYIGDNVFTPAGAFAGCSGFVVRKSSILGAGPIVVTALRGLVPSANAPGPGTPQGVDNFDPAATEGYFIGADNASFGKLMIRRVSTPGGTPTVSTNLELTVAATTYPVTVPHLGSTGGNNGALDALDDRLFAAHIRNGRLWTAHNIQVNSSGVASTVKTNVRNGSRWYEIQNVASTPSVAQWGTVYDSAANNPKSFWIPSIMVSGQGHVAMGFSTAGSTNYINAGTVGRLSGDAPGTMQSPVDYTASSTAYNPPGDPGGTGGRRWGDFSYTCLDPNDDMTMWTIQEFCDASNSYGVRVVRLLAPPPATPAACSPASVAQGQTNVSVAVTGSVISGSGFFDPGTGFPNRVAAVVNGGGVTVHSVTFVNATNLILTLTVSSGASTGARTLAVTNPDGQTVTSAAGVLNISVAPPVTITASAVGSGTISPTGAVSVAYNGTTNFLVTALTGYHIASITTNGGNVAGSPYPGNGIAGTNYVWSNITANGAIVANFAASLAPMGTPEPWLIQYGLTNGTYAAEELTDTDGDGMLAWQEYVAGSVPTNGASVFLSLITMSNSLPHVTWTPDLGTARVYAVSGRTNLTSGAWGTTNAGSRFFRANVGMP